MAKSTSNYSILVGIELKTNDIRKQLERASKNLKIIIDTEAAKTSLNAVSRETKKADQEFKNVSNSAKQTNEAIKQTGDSAKKTSEEMKNIGDNTKKLGDNMRDVQLSFQAANEVFQTSIDIISSLLEQVFELDTALTGFKKVSDLSGSTLENYIDELTEMGNSVGRTTSEMINATTEFRKNSFNDKDAAQLARVATMFQNVSDKEIDAGESASFIISQMVAFGEELTRFGSSAEQAKHIIDSVNEVSNNFSVSSADLAGNLGNMSAVMSQTGASFEESLGMLTSITEVTRNASKASRGLVSIGSRLNQVVDESSSNGKALKEIYEQLGIELFDAQGQLRSSYDIFYDLSQIWETLDKNSQNYIASQQAGTNQFQTFAALMKNFSTAVEATNVALNSAGSATRENEAYMNSLNAKVLQLKSTFQDFANNVISSDLVGALISLANILLKILNTPFGTFLTQITLLTGALWGLQGVLKAMNIIGVIGQQLMALPTLFGATTTAVAGTTTGLTALSIVSKAAFPILGLIAIALSGIITIAPQVSNWWKEITNDVKYATEKLQENEEKLRANKERLNELNSVPISNRTHDIQSEIDVLKEENNELEKNIQYWSEKQKKGKLEDLRQTKDLVEDIKYIEKIGAFGFRLNFSDEKGMKVFVKDSEEALQKLKEMKIVSEDFKGTLEEAGYALSKGMGEGEYKNAEILVGADYYESLIIKYEEFIEKVEAGQEITAEEISRYDEAHSALQEWFEALENAPVSELTEQEKEQIETIRQLSLEYENIIDKVYSAEESLALLTQGASLNEIQFKQLIRIYPELADALTQANGLYKLNQDSLYNLASAGDENARRMIQAQADITRNTINQIETRIANYQAEMAALQSLASAKQVSLSMLSQDEMRKKLYGSDFIGPIPLPDFKNQQLQNEINKLEEQKKVLNKLEHQINSWKPVTSKPISSSGGGRGSSKRPSSSSSGGGRGSSKRPSSSSSGGGSQKDPIEKQNDLFKEQNEIIEHNIFLKEQQGVANDELIKLNKEYQQTINQQANWFRKQGLSENSKYIREAQKQWWSLQKEIKKLMRDSFDERLEVSQNYINEKNKLDNWGTDNEVAAWKRVLVWMEDWYKKGLVDYEYYIEKRKKVEDKLFEAQRSAFDERLEVSQNYINEKNKLDNWGADNEIAAWKRVLVWMDEWYQQGLIDYSYYIEKRKEATNSLIEAEKKSLEKLIHDYEITFSYIANKIDKELQKLYKKQEAYEKLADYMVSQIDKEIEKLEEQKDAEEAYWDEKIAALQKQNQELTEQIEKEEALDALARAKQSKVMVYKDGRFQYIQDTQLVSDAQLKLEQIKREEEYKKQIEALEQQKEQAVAVIDEQIKYWNKYREEWSSLVDNYIKEQDKLLIEQQLGIKLEGDNWKDRVDQFSDFNEKYKDLLDNQISKWEDYKNEWSSVVSDYQENQDKLIAEQILGISLEGDNWKTRLNNLQDYINRYNELMGQLQNGSFVDTNIGSGANSTSNSQETIGSATATIPNKGTISVGMVNEKVQDELPLGTIVHTAGGDYMIVGGTAGNYTSVPVGKKEWKSVNGNAPKEAQIGDIVYTGNGGKYIITPAGVGNYNPASGFWSLPYSAYAYAKGTMSAKGGFSLVGEQGPELRVLSQGDGVIPHNITKNLWQWGSLTPSDLIKSCTNLFQKSSSEIDKHTIIIENFTPNLSNVTNGQDFAEYLKNNFMRSIIQFQGS